MLAFIKKNKIRNYAASLYLPEPDIYAKKFILGWDSHPNRKGSELLASVFEKIYKYEIGDDTGNIFFNEYSLKLQRYFQRPDNGAIDFERLTNLTEVLQKSIVLSNHYLNSNHFVYGVWDHFPLRNGKINVRMDGVWVSKYLSFCVSHKSPILKFKFYFDEFQIGKSTKIFINKKEVPFNVKTSNSGGFIEIINDLDAPLKSESQKKYFYEIFFEFDNCFKDDNNRIYGPFLKKIEFD